MLGQYQRCSLPLIQPHERYLPELPMCDLRLKKNTWSIARCLELAKSVARLVRCQRWTLYRGCGPSLELFHWRQQRNNVFVVRMPEKPSRTSFHPKGLTSPTIFLILVPSPPDIYGVNMMVTLSPADANPSPARNVHFPLRRSPIVARRRAYGSETRAMTTYHWKGRDSMLWGLSRYG